MCSYGHVYYVKFAAHLCGTNSSEHFYIIYTKLEQPLFALMVPHLLLQYPSPLHTNYTGNLRIHKLFFL